MKRSLIISVGCIMILSIFCSESVDDQTGSVVWDIDNLEEIGGYETKILGSPVVIQTPDGRAVKFDGENDAIILDTHPLVEFEEFTVEVDFRPDPGGLAEQRFLHMHTDDDNRILIETRLVEEDWFLDTFIKSPDSQKTLYSEGYLHPLGNWYHVALTYKENNMSHYVNGIRELTGKVDFLPVNKGKMSIGCRLNKVYWFKGAIRKLAFTPRSLKPEEFVLSID